MTTKHFLLPTSEDKDTSIRTLRTSKSIRTHHHCVFLWNREALLQSDFNQKESHCIDLSLKGGSFRHYVERHRVDDTGYF